MNIQHDPQSKQGVPNTSEDDVARRYYKGRLKKSQERSNLPTYTGPEYSSITRTIERFSLMTHLIFLFRRKNITKKEYIKLSLLGNTNILEELRRKKLLSQLEL